MWKFPVIIKKEKTGDDAVNLDLKFGGKKICFAVKTCWSSPQFLCILYSIAAVSFVIKRNESKTLTEQNGKRETFLQTLSWKTFATYYLENQTQKEFFEEIIKPKYFFIIKIDYLLMFGNDPDFVSLWSKKLDIPFICQDLVI